MRGGGGNETGRKTQKYSTLVDYASIKSLASLFLLRGCLAERLSSWIVHARSGRGVIVALVFIEWDVTRVRGRALRLRTPVRLQVGQGVSWWTAGISCWNWWKEDVSGDNSAEIRYLRLV